jgi:zinc/manganese transport system ATP-binding protein
MDAHRGAQSHPGSLFRCFHSKDLGVTAINKVCTVKNLNVIIGDKRILSDITFDIAHGEFTGLIGSNGAGKSTLLRSIMGVQKGASGSVFVNGVNSTEVSNAIGYVPQKTVIDPEIPLRAYDLIALGLDAGKWGVRRRTRTEKEKIEKAIADVNAQSFANQRVGTLSGGQLQRVLIAQALITEPSLLLLDEPLANLDAKSIQEVVLLLHNLSVEKNISIIISSHEINPLIQYMDKVLYLSHGKVAHGTTDEVIRSDVLSDLYEYHVDVVKIHDRLLVLAEPASANPVQVDHPTVTVI